MNRIFKIALAASLLASTVIAAAPEASANTKHKWKEAHFATSCEAGIGVPLLLVGAVLGAVTGGVAAGVAYGAVYTAGGAAIGAGAGTGLAIVGGGLHDHCW